MIGLPAVCWRRERGVTEMARGRTHSPAFKLEVVQQIASGAKRPAQVCREHGLGESLLLRWRKAYEARGEAAFLPGPQTEDERLAHRVAELERFCGQLALENTVLKKALGSVPVRSGTR
jgi:transposase